MTNDECLKYYKVKENVICFFINAKINRDLAFLVCFSYLKITNKEDQWIILNKYVSL